MKSYYTLIFAIIGALAIVGGQPTGVASKTQHRANIAHIEHMDRMAERYGVDKELLYTIQLLETGHIPIGKRNRVVSSAGAIGVMQIMPHHAHRRGDNPNRLLEYRYNIELAAILVRWMYHRNGGSIERTLANYNGGWGQARLKQSQRCAETKSYVRRGLRLYRELKEEGIELK